MKKKLIALCVLAVFLAGCAAHTHVIGSGGSGGASVTKKQFYVLSIWPLNDVDTKSMAGDAENYTIETKMTFVDALITVLTPIAARSVKVTK